MKRAILITIAGVLFGLSSCMKDVGDIQREVNSNIEEMNVDTSFDWKTTRDVVLNLTGYTNGLVRVESTKGLVYQTASLLKYQPYEMKLNIPAHERSVMLVFGGKSVEVSVEGGEINHRFTR